MKRFANYILTGAFLLAAGGAGMKTQAQNDADLLRFSMMNPIGTSRFNAMGGAFGALGANFSALSTNPAGIGLYTRHEISLTGGLLSFSSIGDYYGQSAEIDNVRVNFPQGGGIFEIYRNKNSEGDGLRRLQFGFGANRLKDFNSCSYIQGINTQSSYMDYVTAVSDGYDFGGVDENLAHVGKLAYQTGLMDPIFNPIDSVYTNSYISFLAPGLEQKHILQEKGNISELVFSFGGNVSDKFYFGATLGVPIVNYKQVSIIEEVNLDGFESDYIPDGLEYFDSYRIKQDLKITGSGVNLKLGLIFKPFDFFRIGLAFHTPTYYNLKESSTVSINTNMAYWEWVDEKENLLPNNDNYSYNDFRYNISTPAKGILSLGFLIQNFGAVSVEGELINYRGMRFDMDDLDEQSYMRDVVRQSYKMAGVLRVGTE
ncbi:MAG: hypothetical protein K2M92_01890, partial [Bacteroidales bacterium]|nr:hypothetical protein [Bacteroidales bacterium]